MKEEKAELGWNQKELVSLFQMKAMLRFAALACAITGVASAGLDEACSAAIACDSTMFCYQNVASDTVNGVCKLKYANDAACAYAGEGVGTVIAALQDESCAGGYCSFLDICGPASSAPAKCSRLGPARAKL